MLRKLLIATTAASAALVLGMSSAAFADASGINVKTVYGATQTQNGTAIITRSNTESGSNFKVAITLNEGSTFNYSSSPGASDLQICASNTAFISKVNKPSCEGTTYYNGQFFPFSEKTSPVTVSISTTLSGTVYLQIHINTVDNGVANTSMACGNSGTVGDECSGTDPMYGSVAINSSGVEVNNNGTELPVGAVGAISLAVLLGGGFLVLQRRSRRRAAVIA